MEIDSSDVAFRIRKSGRVYYLGHSVQLGTNNATICKYSVVSVDWHLSGPAAICRGLGLKGSPR